MKAEARPVALVDGEPISPAALARDITETLFPGAEAADGGLDGSARRRFLDGAIDRVLLVREARRRSVVASPEDVDRALERLHDEYPGPHFAELLARQQLDEPGLRARLLEQLTVEKLLVEIGAPQARVSDEDVERYYREHPQEFDAPAQVHALQIVVRTREEAVQARDELRRRPGAFAEVARRVSVAPEAQQGGDLGWFGKGSGMPEVFDRCFGLPLDTISEVTPSPYGFHLFKVVARRPARHRPLTEVASAIREELLREQRARAQDDFVGELRKRATVVIDEAALNAVNR